MALRIMTPCSLLDGNPEYGGSRFPQNVGITYRIRGYRRVLCRFRFELPPGHRIP
jgi:hypothetical protein